MPQPLIVITGASGGIGQALAGQVAAPGTAVGLVGRNAAGLQAAADRVRAAGGEPVTGKLDLLGEAFPSWLTDAAEGRSLTALYANAGLSAGPREAGGLETVEDTERLIALNLAATIATVRAAVHTMRTQPRQRRHVVLVSSIAGLLPLADLAVYCATKAGLVHYGHALRPRLKRDGIVLTVTCPGFVATPMAARHHGAKPFEMTAEAAARKIVAAAKAGRRTSVFPLPFAILAYIAPLGPGWLIDAISPRFSATIDPDPRN